MKADAAVAYSAGFINSDNSRHIRSLFTTGTDWTYHCIPFIGDTASAPNDDFGEGMRLRFIFHAGSNSTSGTLGTSWESTTTANQHVGGGSFFAATTRSIKMTGLQLERGYFTAETMPPFQHESRAENLARCQRYFEKTTVDYVGSSGGSGTKCVFWSYKVAKRTVPTITEANTTKTAVRHTSVDAYGINRDGDNSADLGLDTTADAEL